MLPLQALMCRMSLWCGGRPLGCIYALRGQTGGSLLLYTPPALLIVVCGRVVHHNQRAQERTGLLMVDVCLGIGWHWHCFLFFDKGCMPGPGVPVCSLHMSADCLEQILPSTDKKHQALAWCCGQL